MTPIDITARHQALINLGDYFRKIISKDATDTFIEVFQSAAVEAEQHNSWFTKEYIALACKAWSSVLTVEQIDRWLSKYEWTNQAPSTVAIIMAGNIPFVGLHDLICVLLTGHKVIIKCSSKDNHLLPVITSYLIEKDCRWESYIDYSEGRLMGFDALIATGTDRSARYFEYYFSDYPKIIRKNRHSVAIITGTETSEQLTALGRDIFDYFGLGCRNVSKLFVPKGYDFSIFFEAIQIYQEHINHHKYANNYTYHKAIYLMNATPILDNGFILLKPDKGLGSPLSVLFYEEYTDEAVVYKSVASISDSLQCVLSAKPKEGHYTFGESQQPKLWDYADKIDTIDFLTHL